MKNVYVSMIAMLVAATSWAQTSVVTFNLNMENETVSEGGVYLGGGVIGGPTEHELTDPDGDGVYSVDVTMENGTTGNYIFLNGNCPDWSCKENLQGLPCSDPANWNDRILPEINGDMTISTCFGQCSEDGSCQAPPPASAVTFRVDMSEYTGSYGAVNLNGSFNGWCGSCAEMTDDDADGVYEVAIELDNEMSYEYKFTLDGWSNQEEFTEGDPCTSTIDGYTNRTLTTGTEAMTLDVVCYNSCSACEGSNGGGGGNDSLFTVTFNLNMELEDVDPSGVYLAGGGNFGNPGDNQMTDDDGDGIYSITVEVEAGFSSYYTFTNGACGDWSCKENIAGLPCANPDNFNDRFLPEVTGNTVVSTCFGQCSEDGSCEMISPVPVTFKVDMSEQLVVSGVTIFGGSINGWDNTATPLADDDGDGIYEVTLDLLPGGHEYKFVNSGVEEVFDPIVHGECTVTTADSVYTNRYLFFDEEASVETIAYCFNSCDVCTPDNIMELGGMDFKLVPSITNDIVELRMQGANNAPCEVSIVSFNGALVERELLPANTPVWTLDMSSQAAGVYFVQLNMNGVVATEKLIRVQ